jgi:hypothetical protein
MDKTAKGDDHHHNKGFLRQLINLDKHLSAKIHHMNMPALP